jgi:hypothetical protein
MANPDDDFSETPNKSPRNDLIQVNLRLDVEHAAALTRIAEFEKLNGPQTLRKLIRIADQLVSGADSPFASRLEHLLRKVG